jgi:hypothetical protein
MHLWDDDLAAMEGNTHVIALYASNKAGDAIHVRQHLEQFLSTNKCNFERIPGDGRGTWAQGGPQIFFVFVALRSSCA